MSIVEFFTVHPVLLIALPLLIISGIGWFNAAQEDKKNKN